MRLPALYDPDYEDTPIIIAIDWGLATNFVTGKYPTFLIKPTNNDTDPCKTEVTIFLRDDNPTPMFSNYTFSLQINPLPPAVKVIVVTG